MHADFDRAQDAGGRKGEHQIDQRGHEEGVGELEDAARDLVGLEEQLGHRDGVEHRGVP